MRLPPGISLLLLGSGLYWLLSSQLISSFTVLTPGLFQSVPFGQDLITTTGIIAVSAGLWNIKIDLDEFRRLAATKAGYVFVLPVVIVILDLYSTMISLSLNSQTVELNPFVASAIQYGSAALIPFLISYLALSQGLALLMLAIGSWLFGDSKSIRLLPFALVCGVSAFGPFNNLIGLAVGYTNLFVYVSAIVGSALLAAMIYGLSRSATALRQVTLR